MATYYVGWDVGAWKCSAKRESCDAIVWAKGEKDSSSPLCVKKFIGNIFDAISFQNLSLDTFFESLEIELNYDDNIYIAIDAALGWPLEFNNLINNLSGHNPNIKEISFENKFLYRETERYVYKHTDSKILPKSVVGDRIGGHSAKAISFLKKCKAKHNNKGVWNIENDSGFKINIIETYPSVVKFFVKEYVVSKIFNFSKKERKDYIDAIYCMYIAYKYCNDIESLNLPKDDICDSEGWIFFPKNESE